MSFTTRLTTHLNPSEQNSLKFAILLKLVDGLMLASQAGIAVLTLLEVRNPSISKDWSSLHLALVVAGFYLATLVVRRLVGWTASRLLHEVAFTFGQNQRQNLLRHMLLLPLGRFQSVSKGAVAQALADDILWLEQHLSFTFPQMLVDLCVLSCLLISAMWLNSSIALGAVICLLVAVGMLFGLRSYLLAKLQTRSDNLKKAANKALDYCQGLYVLRAFGQANSKRNQFNQSIEDMRHHFRKNVMTLAPASGLFLAAVQAAIGGGLIVGLLGSNLVESGITPDPEAISAFIGSAILLTACIIPARSINGYNVMATLSRVSDQNISKLEALTPLQNGTVQTLPDRFDISFEKVSFSFPGAQNQALHDISFTAQPGTITAIVGRSGAGKSTLASLLLRFWDVTNGEIKLGERKVEDYDISLLIKNIATVLQETILFDDSIENNLRMGNATASMDQIITAAKAAQIDDFIQSLPDGYQTNLGVNGARLSGGQRQRLSIARAILKNAPVVILDEATSSLDPENECAVQKALQNLAKGRTLFVIAHRLSTIVDADQILLLEDGRLVETGRHEDLLAKNELYQNLWQHYMSIQGWQIAKAAETSLPMSRD